MEVFEFLAIAFVLAFVAVVSFLLRRDPHKNDRPEPTVVIFKPEPEPPFIPNPTLEGPEAPEPRPDEEYPDPEPPTEDPIGPPAPPEPDLTAPEIDAGLIAEPQPEADEPELPPEVPPVDPELTTLKKFTTAEKDAFFKAIGLPYGSIAKRKASTGKFQRAVTWKKLKVDSDFGVLTSEAALICIANGYRISENFHMYEFRCKGQDPIYGGKHCVGCKIIDIDRRVVIGLQRVREEIYKGPLTIVTGYRCLGYNTFVGGINGSGHTLGLAADIPRRFSWRLFVTKGWHGIGKSRVDRDSVVHLDIVPWLGEDHVFQE